MKKYIAILFLPASILYGQMRTVEEPLSFRGDVPALNINAETYRVMPAFDMRRVEEVDGIVAIFFEKNAKKKIVLGINFL